MWLQVTAQQCQLTLKRIWSRDSTVKLHAELSEIIPIDRIYIGMSLSISVELSLKLKLA